MTAEEIDTNLALIRTELEKHVDMAIITDLTEKMDRLQVLDSLSAECMREAKKQSKAKMRDELMQHHDIGKMSISHLKMLVDAATGEEQGREVYADRINAAIHHTVDGLRTMISLYKTQLSTEYFTRT